MKDVLARPGFDFLSTIVFLVLYLATAVQYVTLRLLVTRRIRATRA
ncbi:hypothetical protein [Bradyrhizobium sp.]|nr:hypothetical protein [Bradyrhizobium sp.]